MLAEPGLVGYKAAHISSIVTYLTAQESSEAQPSPNLDYAKSEPGRGIIIPGLGAINLGEGLCNN